MTRKPSTPWRDVLATFVSILTGPRPETVPIAPGGVLPRRIAAVEQAVVADEAAARGRHPSSLIVDDPIPYALTPAGWQAATAPHVGPEGPAYVHPAWTAAPPRVTGLGVIRAAWTDDEAVHAAADALGAGYSAREVILALEAYMTERDRPGSVPSIFADAFAGIDQADHE